MLNRRSCTSLLGRGACPCPPFVTAATGRATIGSGHHDDPMHVASQSRLRFRSCVSWYYPVSFAPANLRLGRSAGAIRTGTTTPSILLVTLSKVLSQSPLLQTHVRIFVQVTAPGRGSLVRLHRRFPALHIVVHPEVP